MRRLTDARQPSVESVRGMFAAMQGPGAASALGQLSDEEDIEYGPKQPESKVTVDLSMCRLLLFRLRRSVTCTLQQQKGNRRKSKPCISVLIKLLPDISGVKERRNITQMQIAILMKRFDTSQVGAAWLADWCMRNSGEVPGTDVNSLGTTVASAVLGGRSGDELAAELFNLLGDDFFESIQVHHI